MDKDTLQEITKIWEKISDIEKRQSDFTDLLHAQSTQSINENSEGLLDVADLSDENSEGIIELAEMIEDINDRLTTMEEA